MAGEALKRPDLLSVVQRAARTASRATTAARAAGPKVESFPRQTGRLDLAGEGLSRSS